MNNKQGGIFPLMNGNKEEISEKQFNFIRVLLKEMYGKQNITRYIIEDTEIIDTDNLMKLSKQSAMEFIALITAMNKRNRRFQQMNTTQELLNGLYERVDMLGKQILKYMDISTKEDISNQRKDIEEVDNFQGNTRT